GTIDGRSVAVLGSGPVASSARVAAADRGANVVDNCSLEACAGALLVAGKTGLIDHHGAESVKAQTVVPLTPLPVTAKAYAAFRRAGIVYVPDFIALAAPLLTTFDPASSADPLERIQQSMHDLTADGPDGWLVAIG